MALERIVGGIQQPPDMAYAFGGSQTTYRVTINVVINPPAGYTGPSQSGQLSGGPSSFHRGVNDAVRREIAKAAGG